MSRGGLCTMQLLFLITSMLGKPLPLTFIVLGEGKQDIALLSRLRIFTAGVSSLLVSLLLSNPNEMQCGTASCLLL